MKKLAAGLLFLLLVFLVAVVGACLSSRMCCKIRPSRQDAHDWIHTQLGLTPQQDAGLDAIEKPYHEKRRIFEQEMALANRELAEAIRSEGKDSGRVQAAIERIHHKMGAIQMLAIGHVFEMKEVLSPAQYKKLLDFTADALNNLDSRHGGE